MTYSEDYATSSGDGTTLSMWTGTACATVSIYIQIERIQMGHHDTWGLQLTCRQSFSTKIQTDLRMYEWKFKWDSTSEEHAVLLPGYVMCILPHFCKYLQNTSTESAACKPSSHKLLHTELWHEQNHIKHPISPLWGMMGGNGAVSTVQDIQPSWTSTNPITVSWHIIWAIYTLWQTHLQQNEAES